MSWFTVDTTTPEKERANVSTRGVATVNPENIPHLHLLSYFVLYRIMKFSLYEVPIFLYSTISPLLEFFCQQVMSLLLQCSPEQHSLLALHSIPFMSLPSYIAGASLMFAHLLETLYGVVPRLEVCLWYWRDGVLQYTHPTIVAEDVLVDHILILILVERFWGYVFCTILWLDP